LKYAKARQSSISTGFGIGNARLASRIQVNIRYCVSDIIHKRTVLWPAGLQGCFWHIKKYIKFFYFFSIFLEKIAVLVTKEGAAICFQEQLLCRGEVNLPLELTKREQDIVRRKFGKYCIEVLNGEALNYLEELDKVWEREVDFSNLNEDVLNQLYSCDGFSDTDYFQIMGMEVPVEDPDISDALRRLPEKKRMIILMAYFLDMTEKEIAECLDLVQSTVHYHKADSLRLLKEILE